MNRQSRAVVFGLCLCAYASIGAQVPPQTVRQDAQQRTDRMAIEQAQQRELSLASRLGALSLAEMTRVSRWSGAAVAWKKERRAGAAPYLANGVLLDCLSRIREVTTPLFNGDPVTPFPSDLAANRAKRAAQEFDNALKADPSLTEARLRRARIRGPKNAAAMLELEQIAGDALAYPFSYIAAISRAEAARESHDNALVEKWYRGAARLLPGSPAAAIGLSAAGFRGALPLDGSTSADPYYEYPCKVMTPAVAEALAARITPAKR